MAAIQEGPDTFNEQAVKRRYPPVDGLVGGTTKQEGTELHLLFQEKSLLTKREKEGLDGKA